MFQGCSSIEEAPDVEGFTVTKVNKFDRMFVDCSSMLNPPNIVGWESTEQTTNLSCMFKNCSSLKGNINLSWFKPGKIYDASEMFLNCENIDNIYINDFEFLDVARCSFMFGQCTSLSRIFYDIDLSKVLSKDNTDRMFEGCSSLSH